MTRARRRDPKRTRKRVNKNVSHKIKQAWNNDDNRLAPTLSWAIYTTGNKQKVNVYIILKPDA